MWLPNKLSGNGEIARAVNGLIDYVRALRPAESQDTLLEHGPMGVIRRARASVTGGTAAPKDSIDYQFKILASKMVIGGYEDGNYILGRKWNESTGTVVASDGSADFWILRPWCLRPLSSRTTRGITVTYVYDADFTTRVASASGHPNENQRIVPNYEAGDVVECLKLEFPFQVNVTPSGAPTYVDVKYVDVTPGRAWARTY